MDYKEGIRQVSQLPLPWEAISGCNILITGATGLIGSSLVEVFMERSQKDYHIFAMGRNENRARIRFAKYWADPSFHFILHDVTNPLNCNIKFHFIIHAASNASPNFFSQRPVEVIKSNIYGVSNLMDYGMRNGLIRFLFVSSGEVYGEGDGRVFTEDYSGYVDCTSPRSCYPSSKRAAESLCVSYAQEYGIDVVIARPSHTYGPYFTEKDNRVYAQFIRNVLTGEDIVMKSTGEQFRSWCYVVDCVSGILHILLKGQSGQAYNIADNNSNITIYDLAMMIAKIADKQVVIDAPSDLEKRGYNLVKKSIYDTVKLEKLGWRIWEGTMENKMVSTIKSIRKNENG